MSFGRLEVLKFGGTSVDNIEAVSQSGRVVDMHKGKDRTRLVVVSAMSGVTKSLIDMYDLARLGQDFNPLLETVTERYHRLVDGLRETYHVNSLNEMVNDEYGNLRRVLRAVSTLTTLKDMVAPVGPARDLVLSAGERMMAPIFANYLEEIGIGAVAVESGSVLTTDNNFGDANPLINATREKAGSALFPHFTSGDVVVMGGFYGSTKDGRITVLGRGGSDRTATALGQVLSPHFRVIEVFLYKADVAGVMSAHPVIVPEAHLVPHMTYQEAAALAGIGGSVIHPKAVQHAQGRFPIRIKSTIDPENQGTLIDGRNERNGDPIKAVTALEGLTRLLIQGWGMDRPGIVSRVAGILAEKGVDIRLIAQPLSEQSVDIVFRSVPNAEAIEELLKSALRDEVNAGDVEAVRLKGVAAVGVIGSGLNNPLVIAQVMQALGNPAESVKLDPFILSRGPCELSILLDPSAGNVQRAVRAIHQEFFK